jgi:hypothetical protein
MIAVNAIRSTPAATGQVRLVAFGQLTHGTLEAALNR